jgi:hypothetical protein
MHPICRNCLFLLLAPILLFAKGEVAPITSVPGIEPPWFTGSLLASSGTVVPLGHINFEPYVFCFESSSSYGKDGHSVPHAKTIQTNIIPYFWVGIAKWADIQITPAWNWKHQESGASHWNLGDWSGKLELQLHRAEIPHKNWIPNIKLGIQEFFPTGEYKKLNPKKFGTDVGGNGAYTTNIQLAMSRFDLFKGNKWLQLRLNLNYAISSNVHLKGYNTYGGGFETNGSLRPGNNFSFDTSLEYSLTQNWAVTFDFVGTFQKASKFKGISPIHTGLPSSIQLSVAPAIEYNWSSRVGIIAGCWLTIAGKNSNKFFSGVIAFNYSK